MSKVNVIFFLGTKAQFIKTIPVINCINNNLFNILLYDTCQHRDITIKQVESIQNEIKHIKLSKNKNSAKNIYQIFFWFIKTFLSIFKRKYKLTNKNNSICVIHGNTLSTILGLIWAKINGVRLIHIEGGYRSFNWFKPFPEEIIRYWVSEFSDYVICFDINSRKNLESMKIKGEIISISRNTIFDTIPKELDISKIESKLIVSVHRNENIYNKKILLELVELIIDLKKKYFDNIIWYTHNHTLNNLSKNNLITKLENNLVKIMPLIEHNLFIKEVQTASCVLTDGESVLEECKIIGVPTYALLNNLENKSSYGDNIIISKYLHKENDDFFKNLKKFRKTKRREENVSPSLEIAQFMEKIINN